MSYTASITITVPAALYSDADAAKSFSFNINPTDFVPTSIEAGTVERVIELRDVATGELLGATMTMGQLFVGVSSLIREQELLVSGA